MGFIARMLFKLLGVPFFLWLAKHTAATIRLTIRKAKRKELEKELEQADTPEERDHAAVDIINHFRDSDD